MKTKLQVDIFNNIVSNKVIEIVTTIWRPGSGGGGGGEGSCGHNIGKLTYPQTKAGPSISKNRPIPRLCTLKHEPNFDEITISFNQFTRKPPIPRYNY